MAKEINYKLTADPSGFKAGVAAAGKELDKLGDQAGGKLGAAGKALQAMGPYGTAAAAGVGLVTAALAAAAAATIDATSAAADYGDKLAALNDQTDLSYGNLQKLELAAKLGNTSIESLAGATNKLQVAITNGNPAFAKLGLNIEQLKKQSPDEQMRQTAQAILALGTAAERTTAMRDVFGKSGPEIIGALKAMASGAADLGGALSDKAVKASADLKDQMDLLDTAVERVKLQFGAAVAQSPELQKALRDLTNWAVDFAVAIGKATPKIVDFFNMMVAGARAAKAAAQGGIIAGFADFMTSASEAGMREQINKARSEIGFGASAQGFGPKAPTKPTYHGAGDDAAAKARQRELEKQRQDLNEYNREYERGLKKQQDAYDKMVFAQMTDSDRLNDYLTKNDQKRESSYEAMVAAMQDNAREVDAYETEYAARARERLLATYDALDEVGGKASELGQLLPGIFGTIANAAGMVVSSVANIGRNLDQIKKPGAGLLDKLSGGLGIAGAAIGVVSFIGGLFGGGKKKRQEEQAKKNELLEDTLKKLDEMSKKIDSIKLEKLQAGVGGVAAVMHNLAEQTGVTQERLNNAGLLGAAMFEEYKRQGLSTVEAFKAMGPALDEMRAAADKNGLALEGTLGTLAAFQQKVSDNEATVSAVEGIGAALDALRATGNLTAETGAAAMSELEAVFAQMDEAGFSAQEKVTLGAQALYDLKKASEEGKVTLDEQTKAMIALAESSGAFEGLEDPMDGIKEALEIMNESIAALVKSFGVDLPASVQKYIDKVNSIPTVPGPPGTTNAGPTPKGTTAEGIYAASGFYSPAMPAGPLAGGGTPMVVHPDEEVIVNPRGGRGRNSGGVYGGGDGGAQVVQLVLDTKVLAEVNIDALRTNRHGMTSQTRRHLGLGR